ncbi:hypothetical protein M3223_04230 [Paenibacillus pasadenensis]|uniref:hypothetical protein n=1 Tax=Paenibacillus pasadenensis TaxID=217090 RepID=UPI00204223D6|nr:hypothetical protein [Paenibacillus pasadenensis]MCM3746557.1 hypothetical protein [Paenibacillus pasadenensis]
MSRVELKKDVLQKRRSGFTVDEIAEMQGISIDDVRELLEGFDKTGLDKDLYPEIAARVKKIMFEDKLPNAVRLVAEEFDTTVHHVRAICRKQGADLNGHIVKAELLYKRNKEMADLRQQGRTNEEIAVKYGLTERTVANLLGCVEQDANWIEVKQKKDSALAEKIVKMRKEKAPIVKIATTLHVGYDRIYQALEQAGLIDVTKIKRRPYKPRMSKAGCARRNIEIITAAEKGETLEQLAERYGLSRQRVRGILWSSKKEVRPNGSR